MKMISIGLEDKKKFLAGHPVNKVMCENRMMSHEIARGKDSERIV